MDDVDPPNAPDGPPSAEQFDLVAHEVRQQILLALSLPEGDDLNPPTLAFSELYDRVDADVNTSQFNYHLQKLLGRFIESREDGTDHLNEAIADEAGYALRPEGLLLVWTLRTGAMDDTAVGPFDAGFACHHCDGPVEAVYRNAIFSVQCTDCGYHYEYNPTPPGIVHDAEQADDILARVWRYNRTVREGVARGVCPLCGYALDSAFVDAADTNYPRADRREAFVYRNCADCGFIDYLTVGECLLTEPSLVAFCHDHGVDVTDEPIWALPFVATDEAVSVQNTDPWTVEFALTLDGDELVLSIDESFDVEEQVRERR
jgi:hypothetical protein